MTAPLAHDRRAAVEYLDRTYGIKLKVKTLDTWACRHPERSPRYVIVAGRAMYPVPGPNGLDDWAMRRLGLSPETSFNNAA